MAKYVQPNFIVDSSASFLRNVAFDSSVYLRGVTHVDAPDAVSAETPYALVLESGSGSDLQIKSKQLGTMAFEASSNYYSSGEVDVLISDVSIVIDNRLDNIDISIAFLDGYNAIQDASILAIGGEWKTYVDGSLAVRDGSIEALFLKNEQQDASIDEKVNRAGDTMTGVLTFAAGGWTLDSHTITNIDTSAEGLSNLDSNLPTSAAVKHAIDEAVAAGVTADNGLTKSGSNIRLGGDLLVATTIATSDTSTLAISGLQTGTTRLAIISDAGVLKTEQLGTMALESSANYYYSSEVNTLINDVSTVIDNRLDNIDISILGLDASMAVAFITNNNQDVSINDLYADLGNYVLKTGDTMTGDLIIDASLIVNGLAVFKGNSYFEGSTYYTDVETISVSTGYIYLNQGITGAPPATLQSGVVVGRGSADPYAFLYDETTQTFRIGITTFSGGQYVDASMQAVATREDTPLTNGIAFWNNVEKRFDTSAGFTFVPGTGLHIPVAAAMNSELTALVWNGSQVGSRELGTMAFEASANYYYSSEIDNFIGDIDSSISLLDGILAGKLDAVNTVGGVVGGHEVYSGEVSNIAYIKKIVAGTGATIISDASTVTISVTGAAGYVSKYASTFDGTAGTQLIVSAATHGLGTGPLSVVVYDDTELVYTGVDCAANGDITLTWSAGSLGATCKYIILG